MLWLTEDAVLVCNHEMGIVANRPSQELVTINGRRALIHDDPERRSINGCQNSNPPVGIRPCLNTLAVQAGYSRFIQINGHAVCLDTVTGLTDGTPPGTVIYKVRSPGQGFVSSEG